MRAGVVDHLREVSAGDPFPGPDQGIQPADPVLAGPEDDGDAHADGQQHHDQGHPHLAALGEVHGGGGLAHDGPADHLKQQTGPGHGRLLARGGGRDLVVPEGAELPLVRRKLDGLLANEEALALLAGLVEQGPRRLVLGDVADQATGGVVHGNEQDVLAPQEAA